MSEASELLLWGIVIHLIIDWLGQNEWMAVNKANLRHPAGYVHAGLHGLGMLLIFAWPAALFIAVTHLLIDTRKPVEWWSRLIRQTQPDPARFPVMDIGADVRIWADQVWHIAVIAIVALVVALVVAGGV